MNFLPILKTWVLGWLTKPARSPIEQLEAGLLSCPQVDCPVTNHFAPGVYCREILMPAGTLVIGHQHKTEHLNVVLSGRARVLMDGQVSELVAPAVFKSGAGVRKTLFILEDMRFVTVHPTKETDLGKLERKLIVKSDTWREHQAALAAAEQLKPLPEENV